VVKEFGAFNGAEFIDSVVRKMRQNKIQRYLFMRKRAEVPEVEPHVPHERQVGAGGRLHKPGVLLKRRKQNRINLHKERFIRQSLNF